jgi:hypothetical protein
VKPLYNDAVNKTDHTSWAPYRWISRDASSYLFCIASLRIHPWPRRPTSGLVIALLCAALSVGVGIEETWAACTLFGTPGVLFALRVLQECPPQWPPSLARSNSHEQKGRDERGQIR